LYFYCYKFQFDEFATQPDKRFFMKFSTLIFHFMESVSQRRGYSCFNCNTFEPAGSKYLQCSVCKDARYCCKDCQIANWPAHKVSTKSHIQVDCARRKANRDKCDSQALVRKHTKWCAENFIVFSGLLMSLMHPISKLRMESYVAVIQLLELPNGFRIVSAEALSIDSLPSDKNQATREGLVYNQTNDPEDVCCLVLYHLSPMDNTCPTVSVRSFNCGKYSNLAEIQIAASSMNGSQDGIIKKLNKEI
jgi:hypothetical protein